MVIPKITDQPPDVLADLERLTAALDARLPARSANTLLLATWNIRSFASLTRKWHGEPSDSPRRDLASALFIAEILSRFDVIAIQEVKSDLRALRDILKLLRDHWSFAMTDVTYGGPGNGERLAFLFDTTRVSLSGLACELVVPDDLDTPFSSVANAFQRQFARTPYAVSFRAGSQTFVLVTLHVIYGSSGADRKRELTAIAEWLRTWAEREDDYGHNLICLGDFNIDRDGDPQYSAFTSTGLTPAPSLMGLPRTIFDGDGPSNRNHYYDQIAWFETLGGKPYLTLDYRSGGNFDFRGLVLNDLSHQQLSFRLSDHLPLWSAFGR